MQISAKIIEREKKICAQTEIELKMNISDLK